MKNKQLSLILMVCLIIPFSVVQSQVNTDQRIHYKCYLQLADQSKVIHRFVRVGKTQQEFEEGLPGSIVYSQDGVTGELIKTVYQCVESKQQFKSNEAVRLEAETPF